jgi:hypothetical protein
VTIFVLTYPERGTCMSERTLVGRHGRVIEAIAKGKFAGIRPRSRSTIQGRVPMQVRQQPAWPAGEAVPIAA